MTATNTIDQPMNPVKGEDRSATDERLRQALLDKRQAEIEAWNRQIEQFRDNLKGFAEDARAEALKRLDAMVQARDQGIEQLRELRQATHDNFDGLLRQTDTAFQKLADQFHSLVQRNT